MTNKKQSNTVFEFLEKTVFLFEETASFYWLQKKMSFPFISIYQQHQFLDILLPWELYSLVFDQYSFQYIYMLAC